MIIHSKNIIDSNSVLLKLTVKELLNIDAATPALVTTQKPEYVYRKLSPTLVLKGRSSTEVRFNEYVIIPENTIGVVYPTKRALLAGVFNTSGVYDTGFKGYVGTTVHNDSTTDLSIDFPLCEMIFFKSSSLYHYNGSYSHDVDTYWVNEILNTGV